MSRAALSLGSNLGDRAAHLRDALEALLADGAAVRALSAVYETAPWGPVAQDDFLNLVAVVEHATSDARGWLARAQALEAAADRDRGADAVRWGPRTLDVDVLQVLDEHGEVSSTDPELTLPHPRLHERGFVLVPWADADPDAVVGGRRVSDLRDALPAAERAGVAPRPDLPVRTP